MFNIREFSSKINQYGGLTPTNLFTLNIEGIGDDSFDTDDIRFFCQSVNIPGVNIDTVAVRPRAIGIAESFPTGVSFDQITAVFMLDSNGFIERFFRRWSQRVINTNDTNLMADIDDLLPFEIGYKEDFVGNITLRQYTSKTYETVNTWTFRQAWPISVGALSMAWSDENQIALLPVTFSFAGFIHSSHRQGSVDASLNRGSGLLDFLTAMGSVSQSIYRSKSEVPKSLQGLVNDYTRLNSSVTAISQYLK